MSDRLPTPARIAHRAPQDQSARTSRYRNKKPHRPRQHPDDGSTLRFSLHPLPPFRLDLTTWTLRRRASNTIDRWDGDYYRRVLILENSPFEVAVRQSAFDREPRLNVTLIGSQHLPQAKSLALSALERLLGLRIDLTGFYRQSATDAKLGPLVKRFRGAKPPRLPTLFEALVNAVACQQMSLSVGIILLSRLAGRFGMTIETADGKACAFPRPEEVVNLEPSDFRELGFSLQKGRAIIALAHACTSGKYDWETLEGLDNTSIVDRLLALPGIGRWSAEYVLLRGFGRLKVYPGDDVGARNNLKRWLGLRKTLDYDGVRRVTNQWQPYAGLVYFHMLLDRLAAAGHLAPRSTDNAIATPALVDSGAR